MVFFDASKNWVILLPANKAQIEKAAGDLARCISLLAALDGNETKPLPILNTNDPTPGGAVPVIILNHEDRDPEQNGFSWRANLDRVEILGDSSRGLCNGIYSFLAALGISWPEAGQEKLPPPSAKTPQGFPLAVNKAHVPSN